MKIAVYKDGVYIISEAGGLTVSTFKHIEHYDRRLHNIENLFFFNSLKIKPEYYGKGHGKDLMIKLCNVLDEKGWTVFNPINPHGNRDLKSLIKFYKASGFEIFKVYPNGSTSMIRFPKK